MTAAALLLAAALWSSPVDAEARDALDVLYDGSTDTALARFGALRAAHPDDPLVAYLDALALCWKIEQRPDSRALDPELHRRADHAIALADRILAKNPSDERALLARGAAHGVRSRLHLFRAEARGAARAASKMRTDLLAVRRLDPENKDVLFGLGLYDYYVDVLPRAAKILRFLLGLPGGDRQRGLASIVAAESGSAFHTTEVEWQLYSIYAFYEDDPDRADAPIRTLRERYPGSPLWALQLAEHRRDRLGLYAESAATAREVVGAAENGRPNYSPLVGAMARLSLGETLLQDLRLDEAQEILRKVADGAPETSLEERAHLLLGRALELEGRRDLAEAQYRIAGLSPRADIREEAARARSTPVPSAEVRGSHHLAEARRLLEAGKDEAALAAYRSALALWPRSREAALRVAADDLRRGRAALALRAARGVEGAEYAEPWIRAEARLVEAEALDATGDRPGAVRLYKEVLNHPFGRRDLRERADRGLRSGSPAGASASAVEDGGILYKELYTIRPVGGGSAEGGPAGRKAFTRR